MILTPSEVEQFYRIWFPLLHFANEKLQVVESFPDEWGDASVDTQDAAEIRIALWEDETNTILNDFIQQNLYGLSETDLNIAKEWKYRISGSFFMFRYLKKYTIFLTQGSPDRAYGVLGILSTFEEMFGNNLPLYVNTTLLPFNGKIIYDSLIAPYPIYFGGGIKSSLKDTYRSIQEREGVIEILPFDSSKIDEATIQRSNQKIINAFDKYLGKSGLGAKKTLEHIENLEQFAEDFLSTVSPPTFLLDLNRQLIEAYLKQSKNKVNLVSFRRFIRFLRDTYRMYPEDAEDILGYLKNK